MENNQVASNEQDLHELLQVRRNKLSDLQNAGNDPFQITKFDVSHHGEDIVNVFDDLKVYSF